MKNYTTFEASKELGVSVRRVQAMIESGRLKAEKFGRDWTITERQLNKVRDRKAGRPKLKQQLIPTNKS